MFQAKGFRKRQHASFDVFVFCVHSIVFAVLLGAGINVGFIIGTWFHPVFGDNTFWDVVIALISGVLIGWGSYGLFTKSERAIRSILINKEDPLRVIRLIALVVLIVAFVAIGVLGLLYRLQFLNQHGVGYLVWIGILLEISTPLFGLVLHPIQNPPAEVLEEDRSTQFAIRHVDELYNTFENLPIHQRHKIYSAMVNDTPEDVHDVLRDEVDMENARRRNEASQKPAFRKRFFTNPFPKAQTSNQADRLSQSNGRK